MSFPPLPWQVGLNSRDFPGIWRPARDEIAFAQAHGFASIQFHGTDTGLDTARLGDPAATVGAALRAANLVPVMEILVRVDPMGYTATGATPLDVLHANLPAITALGCICVHWHLVPLTSTLDVAWQALEEALLPQLVAGVALGAAHGFRFGIEHNEPAIGLFSAPARCAAALAAVPGLGFVWDCNHTPLDQLDSYFALTSRMTMLHVADTPLPAVNHHLPLGRGTIDFPAYCHALLARGFRGPAILEIGGLPHSGGFGRDTDAALIDSLARLREVLSPES